MARAPARLTTQRPVFQTAMGAASLPARARQHPHDTTRCSLSVSVFRASTQRVSSSPESRHSATTERRIDAMARQGVTHWLLGASLAPPLGPSDLDAAASLVVCDAPAVGGAGAVVGDGACSALGARLGESVVVDACAGSSTCRHRSMSACASSTVVGSGPSARGRVSVPGAALGRPPAQAIAVAPSTPTSKSPRPPTQTDASAFERAKRSAQATRARRARRAVRARRAMGVRQEQARSPLARTFGAAPPYRAGHAKHSCRGSGEWGNARDA
jgi:hypothetical protein